MKKLIFSFVILFAAMTASVNAQSIAPVQTHDSEFLQIYHQAIELNKGTYPDFKKIPVDAPVAFPNYDQDGSIIYFPARLPENGKNDCIWYLTSEYQKLKAEYDANKSKTVEPDSTISKKPAKDLIKNSSENVNYDYWAGLGLIVLVLLIIVIYLLYRFRSDLFGGRQNINRNPVVRGGLSNNPAEAGAQIAALIPGSRVVKSERGRLIGSTPAKVKMNFSDGIKKVKLVSGEEYYRITQDNGTIRYARKACGNLTDGSIANLPEGWTFVPSTEENSNWTAPKVEEKNPETEVKNDTTTEEKFPSEVVVHLVNDSTLTGKDVATILEAAGKMGNVPLLIAVGDLFIEFPSKKEE